MNSILTKVWDNALPITGGATGGVAGVIEAYTHTVITAAIFAVVGGVIGYLVKIGMDFISRIFRKKKDKTE